MRLGYLDCWHHCVNDRSHLITTFWLLILFFFPDWYLRIRKHWMNPKGFFGADRLKIWQESSSIVEDVSKEANSSELFPLLLLLSEHSRASALANCCNIWDCQTLGCMKKHELYCCLHIAYGSKECLCELLCISSCQQCDKVPKMWDWLGRSWAKT